jgi:hypothetical protein
MTTLTCLIGYETRDRLDLSRICAAPSARLGHLALEGQGAFASQCLMPTAGVIEAVDVLEDGGFGLTTGLPCGPPDQFGLDRIEEGLNGGVIVAVTLAAHRHLEPMLAQDLLIVMRTIVAAAIAVEDTAPRR